VLASAYEHLMRRADSIDAQHDRDRYLRAVPHHRDIVDTNVRREIPLQEPG
jgi:hypothetical protein